MVIVRNFQDNKLFNPKDLIIKNKSIYEIIDKYIKK